MMNLLSNKIYQKNSTSSYLVATEITFQIVWDSTFDFVLVFKFKNSITLIKSLEIRRRKLKYINQVTGDKEEKFNN